jgi:hypothetical protein
VASTRSNSRKRSAGAETPKDALANVARHAAHVQIAALTATASVIAGWARAADRLVQAVGDELLRRVDGETGSRELVVQVASATDAHLHELAALPSAAANHFDTRLSRVSND